MSKNFKQLKKRQEKHSATFALCTVVALLFGSYSPVEVGSMVVQWWGIGLVSEGLGVQKLRYSHYAVQLYPKI